LIEIDPRNLLLSLCLSERLVAEIFPLCEVRGFQAGESIDLGNSIFKAAPFVIQSGLVSSRFKNGNQSANILDIYGPKTLLHESVFFSDSLEVDFRCETAVKVLALPTKEALALVAKDLAFSNHLKKMAYWRYKFGECGQSILKTKETNLRGIFLLSKFVYGLMQSHSYQDEEKDWSIQNDIQVKINQSLLANHFSISRTNFSQCLQKLESIDLLHLGYGSVKFLNLPAWKHIYKFHRENITTSIEFHQKLEIELGQLVGELK
jgi:hypothetical protein